MRNYGVILLVDRPLEQILPTDDRPLADTEAKMKRLYAEREPVYRAAADVIVPVKAAPEDVADAVERL